MIKILGKKVKVIIDRPLGSIHPQYHNIEYKLNYGYVDEYIGGDGEYQDAYIIGIDQPLSIFSGIIIAIIHRVNDNEDKWVVAPEGLSFTKEQIDEKVYFQEQYFDYQIIN